MEAGDEGAMASLQIKPGALLVGRPNVGKRTLLSRLLSIDKQEMSNLSSDLNCQGWTLKTKYYSAELSIWTTHLNDEISLQRLLASKQLAALVMVFDISDESSFLALKDWVARIDIENFQVLLCIGNKVDLAPGHYAHAEYRRRLQKLGESAGDPHSEFWDYGISETESYSLLGNEDLSSEIEKLCVKWCIEHNIEFIEACASNEDFDKCLSIDGDVQGVKRLFEALAAHMWPGMILKSGNAVNFPTIAVTEDFTDDESSYEIEYELLSGGIDDPWNSTTDQCPSSSNPPQSGNSDENGNQIHGNTFSLGKAEPDSSGHGSPSYDEFASEASVEKEDEAGEVHQWKVSTSETMAEIDDELPFSYGDMDKLMGEIGNMRGNLRLIPDFQRREMAAQLALKMAAMFGEKSSDEDGF